MRAGVLFAFSILLFLSGCVLLSSREDYPPRVDPLFSPDPIKEWCTPDVELTDDNSTIITTIGIVEKEGRQVCHLIQRDEDLTSHVWFSKDGSYFLSEIFSASDGELMSRQSWVDGVQKQDYDVLKEEALGELEMLENLSAQNDTANSSCYSTSFYSSFSNQSNSTGEFNG